MRFRALIPAIILLLGIACQAQVIVELADGGQVRAEVLSEKPDKVYVDLGFTVLSIPRDFIISMKPVTAESGAEVTAVEGQIFRQGKIRETQSVKELVEQNGQAVVTVRTPVGLGSGFIINSEGYVVTNDHVIAGETSISVTVFKTGGDSGEIRKTAYQNVRIVATSPEWDLALLKIEDTNDRVFETVPLGESYELRQGQRVFAIGNPLGLERSVSEGIISIQNRPINGRLFIQTTAEISPGNSGGPLFNMRGEVVGVNNMKVTAMGAEGLGFAIPSSVLKDFLRNRDAFAFDPRNPNNGYRYNAPPRPVVESEPTE